MNKFTVGDKVRAFGVAGVVTTVSVDCRQVEVEFFSNYNTRYTRYVDFLMDGRLHDWAAEPSLVLIERPKTQIKKMMYPALLKTHIFEETGQAAFFFATSTFYESEDAARATEVGGRFIRLLTDRGIEVEVDSE